jgi:hypothetical protein
MKIPCIGGLSNRHYVEVKNDKLPEEIMLLTDPRPLPPMKLEWPPSSYPSRPLPRKREFYNLERMTSQSKEVHYFYRYSEISLDEAMTLLLCNYIMEGQNAYY